MNVRYYDCIKTADNEPQRTSDDIIKSISDSLDSLGKEDDDVSI